MKFTAQEEYGLRCLLQIAREPQELLTIPAIARREAMSEAYVAKLLRLLRRGGLVTSTRGTHGGYRLTRPPTEIDVNSVLSALDEPIFSRQFCERYAGTMDVCVHDPDCSLRSMWMALDGAVRRALGQVKLSDLLRGERAMATWAQDRLTVLPLTGGGRAAAESNR